MTNGGEDAARRGKQFAGEVVEWGGGAGGEEKRVTAREAK